MFLGISIIYSQGQTTNKLILLVDKSSSLKTNDPQDFRKDALKFLVEQNNKYDKIAIYSFGRDVQSYYPSHNNFYWDQNKQKDKILNVINFLTREDDLTDLKQGLSKIFDDLSRTNKFDNCRILILTDAQLKYGDIPDGISITDYLSGVYDMAKLFASKNIPIDAIAFTKKADISYLQNLSSYTNGFARHATKPEDIYLTITEFDENRNGPFLPNKEFDINVSALVSSFKVFAFNKTSNSQLPTIQLINPQGHIDIDYVNYAYKTSVAIEKNNPMQGVWKAAVNGADSVGIYYNKKINYELVVHNPKAQDLSLCKNSIVPFDLEITSENIGKLIGAKCETFIFDSIGVQSQYMILEKSGSRFTGKLKIEQPEGIYNLLIKLSSGEDFIEKKFTVRIEKCEDLNYTLNHDIVLENPAYLTLTKPSSDRSKLKVILITPQNQKEKVELFDDGLENHGDGFANDGILSSRISQFDDAGIYQLEITLDYDKDGIPVFNKRIETIYKVISLKPEIVYISYPDDSIWTVETKLNIINHTSFKVQLKEYFPDIRYNDQIKIILTDSNLVIQPREEKLVKISVSNIVRIVGEHQLNNQIYCDLIDSYHDGNRIVNANINLLTVLEPKTSVSSILIITLISLLILVGFLIFLGLFVIVPVRFKDIIYSGNIQEIRINDFRKIGHPYVDLEDIGRIGISLLGYGYWYHKDASNFLEKYFNKINLRKEKF